MRLGRLLLAICLLAVPFKALAINPAPIIIVGLGHSDMRGRGDLAGWPANRPFSPALLWNYRFSGVLDWAPVESIHITNNSVYPVFVPNNDTDPGVGPLLTAADWIATWGEQNVVTVPCGRGGTHLRHWSTANPDDTSTYYGACKARWLAAEQATGGTVRLFAIALGENDAVNATDANMVTSRLTALIERIKQDTGPSRDVAIAYSRPGEIAEFKQPHFPFWDLVKQQIEAVSVLRARMVSKDDIELKDDGIHSSTAGQLKFGRRYANALAALGF